MSWIEQIARRIPLRENVALYRKRFVIVFLIIFALLAWQLKRQLDSRPPEVLLNLVLDAFKPALIELDRVWSTPDRRVASTFAGSIHQTAALAQGLVADTICVSSPGELDYLSQAQIGLVAPDWRLRFPENSSPFTSSIVFLVRRSAAGEIQDWPDLFQANRRIAVPDPHISGAGQYAYLALIHYTEQSVGSYPLKIAESLRPIQFLPYAASRSSEVFLRDTQYDALLTWESEAQRILSEPDNSDFVIVYPSFSLQIEVVVAIAEAQVERRGTREAAEDYLRFFFSPEGQRIIETAGFRPRDALYNATRPPPPSTLHTVEALFGSWQQARELHLSPNGSLARLLAYRQARSGGTE
ncbi:MAG: hypothetical protein EA353_07845 [Puniceicoccaceae bacterium]|nr:MAG: hypothetical protein EA353_07845 [Puniceicoccaceae bacterium]